MRTVWGMLVALVLLATTGCGDDPAPAPVVVEEPPEEPLRMHTSFLTPNLPGEGYAWEGSVDGTPTGGTSDVSVVGDFDGVGNWCASITKLWTGGGSATVLIEAVGARTGTIYGRCYSPAADSWNETVFACWPCP